MGCDLLSWFISEIPLMERDMACAWSPTCNMWSQQRKNKEYTEIFMGANKICIEFGLQMAHSLPRIFQVRIIYRAVGSETQPGAF